MKRKATVGVGLVLLGLVGLWWIVQFISGPPVPMRVHLGDPRTPGDFNVRLELETPGGPLPVLIHRYFFVDRKDDDVLRIDNYRRLDLGDAMAFWQYDLMTPTSAADQTRTPIASRSEAIPERPGHHRLVLSFEPYGSEFVTEYTGHELQQPLAVLLSSGVWRRPRGETVAEIPFRALNASSNTPLFDRMEAAGEAAAFAGRWRVRFDGSEEAAVGVFRVGEFSGEAFGTFLTPTGDYGHLTGRVDGDLMRLSKFDGAHAFLFHARMRDDGTIEGDFWSGNWHHAAWTAVRDDRAALPDAFGQTSATGVGVEELAFRDLDGTPRRVADLLDAGGVPARVLYLFGSWCPNCADAGAEMKRLKEKYGRRLTIVGLAFEQTEDFERSARQVRLYTQRHGADWPVLIAGLSDKDRASAELPVLDRVRAYPTTIFLDADNAIVAVHTGFSGPATGDEHRRLQRRFETVVEGLIGP
ncbi:MAG: TlpA family protein disulfide reductase [Phycisphaerales bacterium]|nr:TlpA family protein disulfide reductase [Planctomycetota bacterium]MCH8509413.1 TlpA family protein disulfide reductase [Phycisphaerales bacterium]